MRLRIIAIAIALFTIAGTGLAAADHLTEENMPSNTHGMCTSSTRGSDRGIEKKNENSTAHQAWAQWVGENDHIDNDGDGDVDGDDTDGGEVADTADMIVFCSENDPKFDADKAENGNQNVGGGNSGAESKGNNGKKK